MKKLNNPWGVLRKVRGTLPDVSHKLCPEFKRDPVLWSKMKTYTKGHECSRCGRNHCEWRKGR
jgi:hypothetical protein